jgi:opacity protein-like surface antigen
VAGPPPPPSAPWTAPPPPPSWVPRPPRPKRRRVWIYLLVGAVVAIVGLAVASGTIWIQKVKPPIDAANDYLRDISRGNYQAAFDQLCAQEKVDGSPRSLAQTVDALVFSLSDYEVTPFDVRIDGSRATVKADLNPDNVGGTESDNVHIRLQKLDGKWRPCGGRFGFLDAPVSSRSA